MSRQTRQKKRQRQRDRNWRLAEPRRAQRSDAVPRTDSGLELLSYSISFEALEGVEPGNDRLCKIVDEDERAELFEMVHERPRGAIPILEDWITRFPDAPMLYNWLAMAYSAVADDENADRIIQLNYEKNPGYLFAKLNLAQMYLYRGDTQKFEEALDRKFDLKLLCPHRDRFHFTEYLAFGNLMVHYYAQTDREKEAIMILGIMEKLHSEHPATCEARSRLAHRLLSSFAQTVDSVVKRRARQRAALP